jgi:hypothetical protein
MRSSKPSKRAERSVRASSSASSSTSGGVVAVVEEAQIELGAEHGGDRALLGLPREGVRKQGEDVDLHRLRD